MQLHPNLAQILKRTPIFKPSDLSLLFERVHTHTLKPRLSAEEFAEIVASLGFKSAEEFGTRTGVDPKTIETWSRFGMSRDAAQILLALLEYRNRLIAAMDDFEKCTQIPLNSFFEDHKLP
jgi:hypothetical protein